MLCSILRLPALRLHSQYLQFWSLEPDLRLEWISQRLLHWFHCWWCPRLPVLVVENLEPPGGATGFVGSAGCRVSYPLCWWMRYYCSISWTKLHSFFGGWSGFSLVWAELSHLLVSVLSTIRCGRGRPWCCSWIIDFAWCFPDSRFQQPMTDWNSWTVWLYLYS